MKFINNGDYKGFTLAEILITLSIIGVIASMTIPSLVQDINDAQYKTAWKQGFSIIDQATKKMMLDNGGNLKGIFTDRDSVKNNFAKYLNYTKSCDTNNNNGSCWHKADKWYFLNKTPISDDPPALVLNNGNLLRFNFMATNCDSGIHGRCGEVYMDINGFKGPNTVGKDIFGAYIQARGIKPFGTQGDLDSCTSSSQGYSCSALYLYQ